MQDIQHIIDKVLALYTKFGSADYIGEEVSQIEHMSQSAQLAIAEGCDDEVVLASFLHDIGHLCVADGQFETMGGYGVKNHEKLGADFLRSLHFPERIARLVENHVHAKRYLTYKHPEYYEQMSEASKRTLEYQGGKMNAVEAVNFENDPLFSHSLAMRKWDEQAKKKDIPLISLQHVRELMERVLEKS